jgi:hypothetical protein
LSITYFETGYFDDAIFASKGALGMQMGGQKEVYLGIYERIILGNLHSHEYQTAQELMEECRTPTPGFARFMATRRQAAEIEAAFPDAKLARDRIVMNLPRYKPTV